MTDRHSSDFGDHRNSYLTLTTQESDALASVIAGYIDIAVQEKASASRPGLCIHPGTVSDLLIVFRGMSSQAIVDLVSKAGSMSELGEALHSLAKEVRKPTSLAIEGTTASAERQICDLIDLIQQTIGKHIDRHGHIHPKHCPRRVQQMGYPHAR